MTELYKVNQYLSSIYRFNKIILAILAVIIVSINLFFVVVTINESLPPHWAVYTFFSIAGALYLTMVGYLVLHLIEAFGGHCCARLPVRILHCPSYCVSARCFCPNDLCPIFVCCLVDMKSWMQYERMPMNMANDEDEELFSGAINENSEGSLNEVLR